ncbi:MADS-box protein AGL42-like [Salvia hispanica]|uniref:MADS-box protein AGL42-like n=1 Tax=Salvia hispanica TaxID=49212 RepID=UPI00200986B6|nr:MADS-box protein AGL42-like [Salvia hispanica]
MDRQQEASFSRRRACLFNKARQLAVLCDAQVAIIIISSHGKIYEFATSSMQEILTRYKTCLELGNPNPETTEEDALKEAGVSEQNADKLKPRKFLGKDLAQMSSHELSELREKINKGMMFIKDTKLQLLRDELEKSRMQKEQELEKSQMLQRQVEELKKKFVPTVIYNPVPISVHCPATEEDVVQPEQLKKNFVPTKIYNPVPISVYDPATGEPPERVQYQFLPRNSFAAKLGISSGTYNASEH